MFSSRVFSPFIIRGSSLPPSIFATRRQCTCHARLLSTTSPQYKKKRIMKVSSVKISKPKRPVVDVYKTMTVKELARALEKDYKHVYDCLSYLKTSSRVDKFSILDFEVIQAVCTQSGVRPRVVARDELQTKVEVDNDVYSRPPADLESCVPRPPVVTIMGHVDHGKTTLLDYLRKSNIVDKEFGGITQHIGAFSVKLKNGKSITFLDTPGHAAFSAMRGRGARMTDIIVLVVAADDGVMPQTLESIKHAMQSRAPMIVAINKCDRPEAQIELCKQDLSANGVVVEELGGDVMAVPISALKGTNIDALQDAIITQAELMEIRGDPSGPVEGRIIESRTEQGRGKVATVLVQRGTLKVGDVLVANIGHGKVKCLYDENKKRVKQAGPGVAVEVDGWKELPSPGDEVLQVESESKMKSVIEYRKSEEQQLKEEEQWNVIDQHRKEHAEKHRSKLETRLEKGLRRYSRAMREQMGELPSQVNAKEEDEEFFPELHLIVKADVDGSLEAIESCLLTYESDLCKLDIISSSVGEVVPSDVNLASTSNGVIIAFNTRVTESVDSLATEAGVTIRRHNIIYRLIDDVKDMLNERVLPTIEDRTIGEAVIQKVFTVTEKIGGSNKKIPVAGCLCLTGSLRRDKLYKLVRGTQVIYSGTLYMLKHFKTEVDEIKDNMECGLALNDHSIDIQEGDTLLCYDEHEVQPEISWNLPF